MGGKGEGMSKTPNSVGSVMPELAAPQYGFWHTINSALETLERLGVSSRRITIRMAGLGWPAGWIVDQRPEAGTTLTADTVIEVWAAGLGLFHTLPVGMWDRAGDGNIGTQEIVELFDDPFQKAAHWIWEGARIYNLHALACERWIRLFGIDPAQWPKENWYELALLLPPLQRLAGTEEGIRTALRQLLGVEVLEITPQRSFLPIPAEHRCALGRHNRQLGLDTVMGKRVEGLRALEIRLGPMTLARWEDLQQPEGRRRLETVLDLCMPVHQERRVTYEVLDRRKAPRLGLAEANSRLAVNSYLGHGA
ncbi:MAG: type VI secretion system baseplate subunit TssG [Candidatus Solibacter sp.]